jgi:hypothetical protein
LKERKEKNFNRKLGYPWRFRFFIFFVLLVAAGVAAIVVDLYVSSLAHHLLSLLRRLLSLHVLRLLRVLRLWLHLHRLSCGRRLDDHHARGRHGHHAASTGAEVEFALLLAQSARRTEPRRQAIVARLRGHWSTHTAHTGTQPQNENNSHTIRRVAHSSEGGRACACLCSVPHTVSVHGAHLSARLVVDAAARERAAAAEAAAGTAVAMLRTNRHKQTSTQRT